MSSLTSIIRLFLLFVLAIFILIFFYIGLYAPKEQKIRRIQQESSDLQSKTLSLKKMEQQLMIDTKQTTAAKTAIPQEILNNLPSTNDTADLLKQWSKQGKKIGIEFIRFSPQQERKSSLLVEMPIEIILEGTFEQTLLFFSYLSKEERKILISNIEMTQPKQSEGSYIISTHALATTFYKTGAN